MEMDAAPSRANLRLLRSALLVLMFWALSGCSNIRLVADYDTEAAKSITDTSAAVFALYDRMIAARIATGRNAKLAYSPYNEDWGKIETQIRVMIVREESRPLNSDSESIAKSILGFWEKYRAQHAALNDYSAALLAIHRDRFQRLFVAALRAEKAKLLAAPDRNPGATE